MTAEQKTALISEIRADFQIPPYQDDITIGRAVDKCYSRLSFLYGAEFDISDEQGKELLVNAAYYELYHRYEEFEPAWQPVILSWQLGGEVASE